jgi:hypothetical protein
MKRTFATVVLATTLVTGLLGTAATAANASSPKLAAMLLSIGQMPTGWSVDNSSGGSGSLGCMSTKGPKPTASAEVEFEGNGGIPALSEQLGTFANAEASYMKVIALAMACKRFAGKLDGHPVTEGTNGLMSFPRFGDQSAAFAATFTLEGATLGVDMIIIRKRGIVMEMNDIDLAPVNVDQLEGFVKKGVAKLP